MIGELVTRLRFFFRRIPQEDLNEELRAHLDQAVEAHVAEGMSREEARRLAMIEFGSVQAVREQSRQQHPRAGFDTLRQDLRFSIRSLRRDPGFTVVSILLLALGIGANIVVFSLVNTILLRPLPFRDPSRLVWMAPQTTKGGLSGSTYSVDAYEDLRSMNTSYEDVTGYDAFSSPDNVKLTGGGIPQPATEINVVGNFFHVLGVQPELGRDFVPAETLKGAAPVALLEHGFWMRQFHGDRTIVGHAISIDHTPFTVVGVLPESFDFGAVFSPGTKVDLITPLWLDDIRNDGNTLTFMGRLKPGVTVAQATAEAASLFPRFYWGKRDPSSKGAYGPPRLILMKDHVAGQIRRSLYVLWSAVGLILLIVCVNLSNLLLARASARSKEFALRAALGANRGRLIRQLLTESAVLSFSGAALGLAVAYGVVAWLAHQGSVALPLLSSLRVDGAVLLWTLLIAFAACLLFGLAPGLHMASGNLQDALKDSGHGGSAGRKHEGLRTVLVISEVALACVLTVGAGLLLRSFLHVMDVDLGFQPSHAAAVALDVKWNGKVAERSAFYADVLREVSRLPGVERVGISDNLPLARNRTWGPPGVKGVRYGRNDRPSAFIYVVSPGYLEAMGMHVRGRDFAWQDDAKSENVMVLNEKAAQFLFPGQDAVNRMVSFAGKDVRIVGVVPDVHETDVEASSAWQVYLPIAQGWGEVGAQLVVRSSLPPATLSTVVMSKLREMNPNQPVVEMRPLQEFVDHAVSPRRFFAVLVTLFAAVGLVLASIGIYGVISYMITRQTQEIGIRMALGASRERVQFGVLARTFRVVLLGIVAGTLASLVVAKAISSMLFAMQPNDPVTFAGMLLVLLIVAGAAGYLPARRASRIDPMVALRSE